MNEINQLTKRLFKASCSLEALSALVAKEMGVKQNVLWLIYILYNDKPRSQKQICDEWHFPKTTINTIVKECENTGYVQKQKILNDKKEFNIILTAKGIEFANKILLYTSQIETEALEQTLKSVSSSFIDDYELYVKNYKKVLQKYMKEKK